MLGHLQDIQLSIHILDIELLLQLGASSYHSGLDIGAPEGSKLIAVTSGIITFTGFLGGGGYTITLSKNNMKFTYCHVSPNYIVKKGDPVIQGQVIGYVGPKNVYGVKGNQYYDENGNIKHFPVDNYFYEGKRKAIFLKEPVIKYHRTLTTYLNTLLKNDFELQHIIEPQPPKEMMNLLGMKDEMRRPMLLIAARKK